jgi:biopolymer transport protein ExbB
MQVSERGGSIGLRWLRWLVLVVAVLAVVTVSAAPVLAQGGPDDLVAAGPDPAADAEPDESLLTLIVGTGPTGWLFMGVLLVFSFYSVTVAIERGVVIRRIRVLPDEFLGEVRSLSSSPQATVKAFRDLCSNWEVPVARVVEAGLDRCGRPLPEIEKSMEDKAAREIATLRGGIRPLRTIGSVAPLIGLLGTVVGMIVAFRTASQGLGRGERMAEGIYLALTTTAAGLTIAIPALLLSAIFTSRVERFFREMAEELVPTILCLARLAPEEGVQSADATAEAAPEVTDV